MRVTFEEFSPTHDFLTIGRHLDKNKKASDLNRPLSAFPHMTASAICLC